MQTLYTLASGHNIDIPALAIKDPECVGHMTKQGNSHKTWKKRYFVLKGACLYYYSDVNAKTAKGKFTVYTSKSHHSLREQYDVIYKRNAHVLVVFFFRKIHRELI